MLITLLSVVGFFLITVSSFSLAYAPNDLAIYVFKYGLFILFILAYGYLIFFGKSKRNNGKTVWRKLNFIDKCRQLIFVPLFFVLMVFCMQRWMAYPTKWTGDNFVVETMQCIKKSKFGNSFRNKVMIEAVSLTGNEQFNFPWPTDKAPECSGEIEVAGYAGLWGVYVVSLRTKEQKILDKQTDLLIYR